MSVVNITSGCNQANCNFDKREVQLVLACLFWTSWLLLPVLFYRRWCHYIPVNVKNHQSAIIFLFQKWQKIRTIFFHKKLWPNCLKIHRKPREYLGYSWFTSHSSLFLICHKVFVYCSEVQKTKTMHRFCVKSCSYMLMEFLRPKKESVFQVLRGEKPQVYSCWFCVDGTSAATCGLLCILLPSTGHNTNHCRGTLRYNVYP